MLTDFDCSKVLSGIGIGPTLSDRCTVCL